MTTDLPQDLPDRSPQPRPGEQPPLPADVRSVPGRGLEPRSGRAKRVVDPRCRPRRPGGGLRAQAPGPRGRRARGPEPRGRPDHTLRSFAPGLYAEAGAMRIPRAHDLTLAYCEEFGLPLRPFVMGNPNGLVHVGGRRMTVAEANADSSTPPLRPGRSGARPDRRRAVGGGHRRVPRDGRGRG